VIDGCPAGVKLAPEDLEEDINRRRPGVQGTTARVESDIAEIVTGVLEGRTTGAPLTIQFSNFNAKSKDYYDVKDRPRPGHVDLVARQKFGGFSDHRGGGHFSGRLTLPLVAAGAVAKMLMNETVAIQARVTSVHGEKDYEGVLKDAMEEGDSVGGIVECRVAGLPPGLGEPFFDSVESLLSHALFAIPGVKAVEFGAGFKCAEMLGSEYNDEIVDASGKTATNHSGGINGGLTNGNQMVFRVAVRPPSSISAKQRTVDLNTGEQVELSVQGRHDACIALRVPVAVEAAAAIVIADLMMLEQRIPRVMK